MTSITIPTSVTNIGSSAFSGTGLTSLIFNAESCADFLYNSSTEYTNYISPFYNLTTLQSVTIGETVKHIPAYFIVGCSNVTSLTIPESVTSIGDEAFYGCTSITSLVFNAESCADFSWRYNSDLMYNSFGPFYNLTTLHSVTIGETVKHIPAYFINGCNNVTSITIPEGVTNIGERAFSGCSGLTLITIPSSVTSVGNAVFAGCLGLTSITIPSSVTSIGNSVFWGCSGLTSLTIPSSVTSIAQGAFGYCSGLTSLTIPSSVTSIGDEAFYYCSGLTSLTIPSSVTSIGDEAFYYCSGLTSITIPSSVTSIGEHAFDGCEQLTQIELPSIKTIAPYAFANCIRLSKAMFGQNLDQIGDSAFANCGKLIRITCYATIVPLGNENSFANYNGYLYVPCDLLVDYEADLLFGKFKYIQCIAAEPSTSTTEVTIVSGATDATFTWPVSDNTQSYTLEISKDGEVFCTLRFNGNGQLLGISFAPSNGTETQNVGAALTALGYQFSVTGLNSASLYTYELKALDASNNELASYAGQFSTDGYVGIGNVEFIEGVYAQNGAIVIDNDTNLPVAIYDVVGRLLASGSSLTQYFEVPNAGVYIVKVGDQTMKVLVP